MTYNEVWGRVAFTAEAIEQSRHDSGAFVMAMQAERARILREWEQEIAAHLRMDGKRMLHGSLYGMNVSKEPESPGLWVEEVE